MFTPRRGCDCDLVSWAIRLGISEMFRINKKASVIAKTAKFIS
jgi:hypothetical protein